MPLEALFPAVRTMIRLGQFVEKKLVADVLAEVTAEQRRALTAAYLVGAAAALILTLVVLLSVAVARTVARPLTRLTRSADRVARVAEAELVRVTDDEGRARSRSGWIRWTSGPTTRSATWRGPSTGCRTPPRGWSNGRWPADATWRRCSATSGVVPRTWWAGRSR
ncbi:hypothetical protein NKG94_38940 [Micromonospora sp. M12]